MRKKSAGWARRFARRCRRNALVDARRFWARGGARGGRFSWFWND